VLPSIAFAAVWEVDASCEDAVAAATRARLDVDPAGRVGTVDAVGADAVGVGLGDGAGAFTVVVAATGAAVVAPAVPQAWNSASPMFSVVDATDVMLNRTLVTVRAANVIVVAAPALSSDPTATDEPLENTREPAVTRSPVLGRSYRTTLLRVTGLAQVSWIQLPALPSTVAHSLVWSVG
jgi:hypothetical protein